MVTEVDAVTVAVLTVNVALLAPAATVTLVGTVATAVLLLDKLTTAPPLGASPLSVTVPCEVFPPVTLVGETPTPVSVSDVLLTTTPTGALVAVVPAVSRAAAVRL